MKGMVHNMRLNIVTVGYWNNVNYTSYVNAKGVTITLIVISPLKLTLQASASAVATENQGAGQEEEGIQLGPQHRAGPG